MDKEYTFEMMWEDLNNGYEIHYTYVRNKYLTIQNSTKLLHTKTIIKSCKKRATKNVNVNTKKSQRNVSKYGGH